MILAGGREIIPDIFYGNLHEISNSICPHLLSNSNYESQLTYIPGKNFVWLSLGGIEDLPDETAIAIDAGDVAISGEIMSRSGARLLL